MAEQARQKRGTDDLKSVTVVCEAASVTPFSTAIAGLNELTNICDEHIIALTTRINSR